MISFVKGSELSHELEKMIANADKFLWLISPYIKLSGRIKDDLKRIIKKDHVALTVVYGKNDADKSKSLTTEDLEFFKEFPNIKICYEKNLHAKYYASEDFSLLCSMNLYEFSQNTNVEAGVKMEPKDLISGVLATTITNSTPEANALHYFAEIIESSEVEFHKKPIYKSSGLLGMSTSYSHSEIVLDNSSKTIKKEIPKKVEPKYEKQSIYENKKSYDPKKGYCIRTGVEIPFDVNRPYSYDAFKVWNQFQNIDFKESYCHETGQASNGTTSMRNPIMKRPKF